MQEDSASNGDPCVQPVDLCLPEWRWIEMVLPVQREPLAYDRQIRIRIDDCILKIFRTGDAAAADVMYNLSLGFVAAPSDLQPRVFWQVCAAYFEALSNGLCAVDAGGKRALSGILRQYRALAAGEGSVSLSLLRELLFLVAQADPGPAAHPGALAALRQAYGLTGAQPMVGERPDPGRFDPGAEDAGPLVAAMEDQTKVVGTLRIDISVFNAFLNEADEWSRRLFVELSEWALELHRPVADSTVGWAHSLANSSASVGLRALSELADALEQAIRHVQHHAPAMQQHLKVFLEAAEDIRRLLHQFAAGFLKQPEQRLLDALRDIARAQLAQVTADSQPTMDAVAVRQFAAQSSPLMLQLGGALRQWTARPDNVGARNESMRLLRTLEHSALLAGPARLREKCRELAAGIEKLGTQALQTDQLEPLLGAFDTLKTDLDRLADGGR
ncbi:MAG: hypothetical protein ACOYNZ_06370 [Rhodoferax sp.]